MKGNTPYLVVNGLKKHYGDGEARIQVLSGITTTVNRGEVCVMLGPSGSGKSTFLNLIGGLEDADGGTVSVGDCELTSLSSKDLGEYRRRELGFVFLACMQCAVTRTTLRDHVGPYLPDQKFTVQEALDSYTIRSAEASFEENVKGQIAEGMMADFVVLGQNPFEVDESTIKDIPVCRTYLAGELVYEA